MRIEKKKTPERRRAGYAVLKSTKRTAADVAEWMAASNQSFDEVKLQAAVINSIDEIEASALQVFERHSLPSVSGAYWRAPGEAWIKIEPGASVPTENVEYRQLHQIGQAATDVDTELGFASVILERVWRLRTEFTRKDSDRRYWLSLARLIDLLSVFRHFEIEFALGKPLGAGLKLAAGWSDGGKTGSTTRAKTASERHQFWQKVATGIWRKNRSLSNSEVARRVAGRVGGNWQTIRQRIHRPTLESET